jgi:hypothetical protein
MFLSSWRKPWHRASLRATTTWVQQSNVAGRYDLYSRLVFLSSITIAVLSAASAARAADSERCQELTRRFEDAKPQINAMEVSRTLFSAVDVDCIALRTELLDYGA